VPTERAARSPHRTTDSLEALAVPWTELVALLAGLEPTAGALPNGRALPAPEQKGHEGEKDQKDGNVEIHPREDADPDAHHQPE